MAERPQISWSETLADIRKFTDPWIRPFTIAVTAIAVPLAMVYLVPDILGLVAPPPPAGVDLYAVNRPIAFTFLDEEGHDAGHRGAVVGERLKLEDMPAYLPAAFIAMEDRRFYSHNGVDPRGLLRALVTDLRARKAV